VNLLVYNELMVLLIVNGSISSKLIISPKGTPVSFTDLNILEALLILNKSRYSLKNSGLTHVSLKKN